MRFRRAPLFALLGCFLSIAMGFPGSVAWGISSGRVLLPLSRNSTQSFSRQSGISLAVDTAWVGIHGYRPVFCTVTRQVTPSKSDMQIRLRFKAGRWRTNKPAIIVEQEFELPAGDTTGTFSFLVPQYVDWRFFACETWVDGVKDKELCVDEASYASDQSANNFSALVVGDGRDFRIRRLFNDIRGTPAEVLRAASLDQFDTWLKYSPLDVVATTTARLEALASTESTHFAELLKWVRTGGNLWVFASGEDYRDLARIEAVLDIAPNLKDKTSSKDQMIARGWRFPLVNDPTRSPIDSFNQLSDATDNSDLQKTEQDNAGLDEPAQVSDSYKWFAAQLCGFGTVVVFPFPAGQRRDSESTSWAITQSLVSDRISWDMRHGVNSGLGNENFNDFLIPEVGFAPVFAFQFLLSLFVLAIGPANYYYFRRRGQLPMLLVTIPLAAILTTGFLFAYSFWSDGFAAMVRARSLTLLDQRSGTATSWSRLSYFAGLAPSAGLSFPRETLLYPILPTGNERNYRSLHKYAGLQVRELTWNESQSLTHGWLASRTPTQYLGITSNNTKRRLEFAPDKSELSVTNQLGVDLRLLIVNDEQGQLRLCEALADGKSQQLSETKFSEVMLRLRSLFSKNSPEFPPGIIETLNVNGQMMRLPFSENLMELQLAAITSVTTTQWQPNTYLAVTDRGCDLALGIDAIAESNSFHVIKGSW